MGTPKKPEKAKAKSVKTAPVSAAKAKGKNPVKPSVKTVAKTIPKPPAKKSPAIVAQKPAKKPESVTAKQNPAPAKKHEAAEKRLNQTPKETPAAAVEAPLASATPAPVKPAPKPLKTTLDDLALDIEEKDELLEEEKKDLVKVLREDEDEPLETAFVPTDTSERYILVVDEEGQRRNETMTIVSQILPNAVVEVADDPEEALEIMQEADFDTYVVNFLMPGYSASPFVKAVANHPDHPLLIGFAADKISDALDQKKGLKIIPLKRLFDLEVNTDSKEKADKDD